MIDHANELRRHARKIPHPQGETPGVMLRAADEIECLRAKIEAMERQEPVTWQTRTRPAWNDGTWGPWRKCSEEYAEDIKKTPLLHDWLYEARALYTLPGAQPAPSVPDTYAAGINAVAVMLQSKADEYAKEHGHDYMGGLSFGPGMGGEIKMDYYTNLIELVDDVRAMLADAPEAKP